MKKISFLIVFSLIVTITGVYAAWNYAQGTSASVEITREINMAQVNTDSNKGSISVTPSNVAFLVDDAGAYVAKLTGTGEFAVNFTASNGADSTTATNGIKMIATVTVKSNTGAKYNGSVPITAKEDNVIVLNNGEATKTTTLTVADIISKLELMDVTLPTKQDNDNFHNILKDYTFVITISESVS